MYLGTINLTGEYQEIFTALGVDGEISMQYALLNNGNTPVHLIDIEEYKGFDEEANTFFVPAEMQDKALTILAPGEGTVYVHGDNFRCFAKGQGALTVARRTNYGLMT